MYEVAIFNKSGIFSKATAIITGNAANQPNKILNLL